MNFGLGRKKMRETYIDDHGVKRFKPNRVVRYLLDTHKGTDLNDIWRMFHGGLFTAEEMKEFYQMINYSVCGYEEVFDEEDGHEGEHWG